MTDYTELKRLAEAATPGPWSAGEEHESTSFQGYTVGDAEGWIAVFGTANDDGRNAAFMAAANPAAILALIAENEQFRVDRANAMDDACLIAGEREQLKAEVDRLNALINTPHTDDWFEGVRLEPAHQIERWGTSHDEGKQPADWFWLLGYLGGKALAAALAGNIEKAKHHTISSGAALLNWFRAISGDSTAMRPGTDSSKEVGHD